jgi:hypothetical protein
VIEREDHVRAGGRTRGHQRLAERACAHRDHLGADRIGESDRRVAEQLGSALGEGAVGALLHDHPDGAVAQGLSVGRDWDQRRAEPAGALDRTCDAIGEGGGDLRRGALHHLHQRASDRRCRPDLRDPGRRSGGPHVGLSEPEIGRAEGLDRLLPGGF